MTIQKKREKAYKTQAGRCWYCGAPMWEADDDMRRKLEELWNEAEEKLEDLTDRP